VNGNPRLLLKQFSTVVLVAVYAGAMTFSILSVLRFLFVSIRLSESEEEVGSDWIDHGEVAYHKLQVLEEWEKTVLTSDDYQQFHEKEEQTVLHVKNGEVAGGVEEEVEEEVEEKVGKKGKRRRRRRRRRRSNRVESK